MSWTIIAVLIIIGLTFIVLEILVIPGQGVAGIIGLIIMAVGIWQTYAVYGTTSGHIVLGASFVASVVSLIFSLRSKTWKKMMLKSEINGRVNEIDAGKIKQGDTGKSISRLVPAGKALFGDEYFEVHTYGTFIDQNTEIEVVKIENNKIFVKQAKK
jgi:membrane-bound ClpP family serine protease